MVELAVLGVFAAALLLCVAADLSILYALVLGYGLFFAYGLWKTRSVVQVLRLSLAGIGTVKTILVTFLLIGAITAVWRAGGTIPFLVYYATKVCVPQVMVLLTFLLCCLLSALTGTAFGTAATVGVICMTMANGMGIPPVYTGGAVLAGSYFGDRCSPMSTSALLVSELTGTNLFRNISVMIRTSLLPFFLSCGLYLLLGAGCSAGQGAADIRAVFAQGFDLTPLTAVPAAAMVLLSLFRINVKITMAVSMAAGAASALWTQHAAPGALLHMVLFGYHADSPDLAALLDGGGVLSMARVLAIVCLSACYAGIFNGTGFLDGIKGRIGALARRITPFGAVLATAVLSGMVACNQTLTIMLSHQLCQDTAESREAMASYLENTAVVVSPLIPWSIACTVTLGTVDAPAASILAASYLYLLPLWNLIQSLRRRSPVSGPGNRA